MDRSKESVFNISLQEIQMMELFFLEMGDALTLAVIFIFALLLVKLLEDMGIINFPI
jgi:hypothetical protein